MNEYKESLIKLSALKKQLLDIQKDQTSLKNKYTQEANNPELNLRNESLREAYVKEKLSQDETYEGRMKVEKAVLEVEAMSAGLKAEVNVLMSILALHGKQQDL